MKAVRAGKIPLKSTFMVADADGVVGPEDCASARCRCRELTNGPNAQSRKT